MENFMTKPLEKCPVCQDKMFIRTLECSKCQTQVKSQFSLSNGDLQVPEDFLSFIKVFIYAEGNIKQCEKLMNCSYPKIKNLLKKTKTALGVQDTPKEDNTSILEQLEQGEIDVEVALNKLKKMNQ